MASPDFGSFFYNLGIEKLKQVAPNNNGVRSFEDHEENRPRIIYISKEGKNGILEITVFPKAVSFCYYHSPETFKDDPIDRVVDYERLANGTWFLREANCGFDRDPSNPDVLSIYDLGIVLLKVNPDQMEEMITSYSTTGKSGFSISDDFNP